MSKSRSVGPASIADFFAGVDIVPALLDKRAALTPDAPAHVVRNAGGAWHPTTWSQLAAAVDRVADAFAELGLTHGDRIAILSSTSQYWEICQLAALRRGATVIGIDPYYPDAQINQLLPELKTVALAVGDSALLQRVNPEVRAHLGFVVLMDESAISDDTVHLATVQDAHQKISTRKHFGPVSGGDPAIIVFSSGTTGNPKPIVYTHAQVCLACRAILEAYEDFEEGSRLVCWLPLANLFQRILNFCGIVRGAVTYIVNDPRLVMDCVPIANPHVFIAVPRFCERLHAGIQEKLAKLPPPIAAMIRAGIAVNMRENKLKAAGARVPLSMRLQAALSRKIVLGRLRHVMGSSLRYIVTGSAPCPDWLLDFFAAIGLPILEAYGQSENIIPIAANLWSANKRGTVGRPLKYNEVRLSETGVVQVKSPGVFQSHLAENKALSSLTPDGYLDTGDLGEFLPGGYLKLTGRKNEVVKTASGRWLSPADIEAVLRRIPYVEQVVALVHDSGAVLGILVISDIGNPLDLRDPHAQESIRKDVFRELNALPKTVWPRGLLLTTTMFSVEGGELTTNLKLRRAAINSKYDSALARLGREVHDGSAQGNEAHQLKMSVL